MSAPLIAPSILACDFASLGREVEAVAAAGADWIHVDVMDGHFVPNITIGPDVVAAVRRATELPLDVHLMIEAPDRYLEDFISAGASYLTVHAEATTRLYWTVRRIRELGAKPAVVINPGSPLELVMEVLDEVDMVLLMTVEPGFGGQKFLPSMLEKVRRLRSVIDERGRSIHVEVDGGIDRTTASEVARAGADVLVAGTAIFKATSYKEAIDAIRQAATPGD